MWTPLVVSRVHASAARACEWAQASCGAKSLSTHLKVGVSPPEEKWELTPHSSSYSEDPLFTSGDLITFGLTFLSYLGAKCLVTLKHQTFPLINICYLAF